MKLGAWSRIPIDRRKAFTQMKVWDSLGNGKLSFNAPQTNADSSMGYIVENSWMRKALADCIAERANSITVFNKSVVEAINFSDEYRDWPVVDLNEKTRIQTRLLVGADGANSLVRKFAGIQSLGWEYQQKAVVATLDLENVEGSENDIAYQRFLPGGPIAVLPLSATKSSLVWSTTPDNFAKLSKLSDSDFSQIVDIAFRNPVEDLQYILKEMSSTTLVDVHAEAVWGQQRLHQSNGSESTGTPPAHTMLPRIAAVVPGSRAGFPLRFWHSERYIGDAGRVALVGDAAHTIHPLAGQGMNLGLLDAHALAQTIERAVQTGADIGHVHVLQDYARERYASNLGMMVAVDSVGRLFRAESDLVVGARSFGMNLVDILPGFKDLAMRAAASVITKVST
ncbi:putative ubiquinone biosynthesis monooxygenase [Entophlyctis luteolus]|nr:putative ubiquinone biosynthesis monooxygenase [Entophlyctis luteolus]